MKLFRETVFLFLTAASSFPLANASWEWNDETAEDTGVILLVEDDEVQRIQQKIEDGESINVDTDLYLKKSRNDSSDSSYIRYLDISSNTIREWTSNGGYEDNLIIEYTGTTSVSCSSNNGKCAPLNNRGETEIILIELRFTPRAGWAHNNQWSRNQYTLTGSYYNVLPRPTNHPSESPAPYVKGDPHFMTWAGKSYDFHGVCDLVLVHSAAFEEGKGLDIHLRTERMKMWSFVASAAIRIGQDIFEVMGGKGTEFWTNGVEGKSKSNKNGRSLVSIISGYPIYRTVENEKQSEFVIDLGDDEQIVIGTWHSFVRVSFENVRNASFKDSEGLLGSFPDGLKLSRDGSTIIEDINMYGQEWQVCDSEPQLFHNTKHPQYPLKCEIPSSMNMRHRLEESNLTMEEASKSCANANESEMDLCIFDVMATNNKKTAGAY